MKKTKDKFELGYPMTRSLNTKVKMDAKSKKRVLAVMDSAQKVCNITLKLLLTIRGEAYNLVEKNGTTTFIDKKQVEKDMLALRKKYNVKMPPKEFISACKELYARLISSIPRSTCNFMFNTEKEDVKLNFLVPKKPKENEETEEAYTARYIDKFNFFRSSGIFPVKNNLIPSIRFVATINVMNVLKSFEAKQLDYDTDRNNWENKMNNVNNKMKDRFIQYNDFLENIEEETGFYSFKQKNYKRLINRWRGKTQEKTSDNKPVYKNGMHEYFETLPDNHVFTAKDKAKFGYDANFMNYIFKHKEIWDIIGDQKYVSIIVDSYHWLKKSVNIPLFGVAGKKNKLNLGKNFISFDMQKINGELILTMNPIDHSNKKITMKITSPELLNAEITKIGAGCQ